MTYIQRLDGTTYDLKELGIRTREIIVSSPPSRHTTSAIDGRDGEVDKGTDYGPRPITGQFTLFSYDLDDYVLMRDEVFHIFRTKQPFYLIDRRYPVKRYKVKVDGEFEPERAYTLGKFDVDMICNTVYAESLETSQFIQENGIDANDEVWGFGMGLIANDDSLIYTHTGTSFKIWNPSNIDVLHPFEQELKITIDNVQGSTSELVLRNTTNGTEFKVTEAVSDSQTIVLDGANVTSNGLVFLRSTNRKFISLVPGWNEFQVTGATSARVAFDFRFYYY
ncbi:phage tail family protein [Gracilibacillus thailandensis]|uniref:Phage tail family protein n=1 Tax=Gracilibacillus thailandensis TaxID=563735 RepID=A0A6N7R2I4_9BACI|nr:phage tail family protein [Gracilibacillus thailandensis]MRI65166.1 phage tail family protein [Gracilibacillus thailandensis]